LHDQEPVAEMRSHPTERFLQRATRLRHAEVMGPAYAKGFRHRQAMARPVFVTYGEARKPAGEAEVGGLSGELGARLGGKQRQGTETGTILTTLRPTVRFRRSRPCLPELDCELKG